MKLYHFLFCAFSVISLNATAQKVAFASTDQLGQANYATEAAAVGAQFPGGTEALGKFFDEHLVYDVAAKRNYIEGTVKVRFTVGKDGLLSDFEIIESPHQLLSRSALATVKEMPAWIPSMRDGSPIVSLVVVPVEYRLK